MSQLDRRLNASRPDLADSRLRDIVESPRFVEGEESRVLTGIADLRRAPSATAGLDSQLLSGEALRVFDRRDGWAWVQNESDGYVGYCEEAALDSALPPATHFVRALHTPLFPEPDLKTPPIDWMSYGGAVAALGESGPFLERAGGGWIFAGHLLAKDAVGGDFVEDALRFVGTPYLWGGRSGIGLDCSSLVQLTLRLAGIECRRDSDQQEADPALGARLAPDSAPKRGDLIYWGGHVAIALDSEIVVNATGHSLNVAVEPLAAIDARARAESGEGIHCLRRPFG